MATRTRMFQWLRSPKLNEDPACAPPETASIKTAKSAATSPRIKPHRALFNRPFITPPNSNHRNGKCLRQFLQIQNQRQPVLMPQHAAAMRDIAWRFVHKQGLRGGAGADNFVGGDSDAQNVAVAFRSQRSNNHMIRLQVGPASFGESKLHNRNNRAAQTEYPD